MKDLLPPSTSYSYVGVLVAIERRVLAMNGTEITSVPTTRPPCVWFGQWYPSAAERECRVLKTMTDGEDNIFKDELLQVTLTGCIKGLEH